jgi:hypothetical protein
MAPASAGGCVRSRVCCPVQATPKPERPGRGPSRSARHWWHDDGHVSIRCWPDRSPVGRRGPRCGGRRHRATRVPPSRGVRAGQPGAERPARRRRVGHVDAGRVEGQGRGRGRRSQGGERGPRRPGAAHDAQPPGLPLVRHRRAVPARDAGEHLQLVLAGRGAVPRRPRRGRGRDRRGRRLPRAHLEGARRAAAPQAHLRGRAARGSAPRGRATGDRPVRRAARTWTRSPVQRTRTTSPRSSTRPARRARPRA